MNKSLNEIFHNLQAGNLSPEEWNYVFQLTGTESKEHAYLALESIIKNTEDYKSSIELNTNKAWERFEAKIQAQDLPQISTQKSKSKFPISLAAMSLVLIIGISIAIFININKATISYTSQNNAMLNVNLADHSAIVLNKSSKLMVANDFNKDTRKVKLQGEAFFDIAHNKNKAFIIEVNHGYVTVVGTSFNVESNADSDTLTITVKSGLVKFVPDSSTKEYFIKPNESLIFIAHKSEAKIEIHTDMNASSWIDKDFSFESQELADVFNLLNKVYGNKYILENLSIGKCKFTGNFENISIPSIHQILKETMGLQIDSTGEKVYKVTGRSCQ